MLRHVRVAVSICGLVVLSSLVGIAAQWVVSQDGSGTHRSVQGAIDAAAYGDTVYVNPGLYEEHLEFKNGVILIGAGADHTIIRNGYGFQEVLHARNTGSGRIEGMTFERMGSILTASVVVLESATLTMIDCTVIGGQRSGVAVSGVSARPTFKGCTFESNGNHGVWGTGGARVEISNCLVRTNGGAGVLLEDATAEIAGSRFASNGTSGLVLVGSASARVISGVVEENGRWGVDAYGTSRLTMEDCYLSGNSGGAMRFGDFVCATLQDLEIAAVGDGIRAEDSVQLELHGGTIHTAGGSGILLHDGSTGRIERVEVSFCSGDGVEIASTKTCSIDHVTATRNQGDGIRVSGAPVIVRNSIFALNEGAGIRVDPAAASGSSVFGYNTVWGNRGGDYVGLSRRSSDLAASPGFLDPENGNFGLRADSPCIDAGEWGETIGASLDPNLDPGIESSVSLKRRFAEEVYDLGGVVRLAWFPLRLEEGQVRLTAEWGVAEGQIETSLFGLSGSWWRVDGRLHPPSFPLDPESNSTLSFEVGLRGMFDGPASWWRIWGSGQVVGTRGSVATDFEYERPTRITSQSLRVVLGPLTMTARATDLTLNHLSLTGSAEFSTGNGAISADAGLTLVPDGRLNLGADWTNGSWLAGAEAEIFVDDVGHGTARWTWADLDGGGQVDLEGEWADSLLEEGGAMVTFSLRDAVLVAEFAVNRERGARLRLSLTIDTSLWLTPRANEPPTALLTHSPYEPEVGETVRFDASDSHDPDGAIDQYWWDFGDGSAAMGTCVEHAFAEPGEHAVTLTVSDEDGTATSMVLPIRIWSANTAPVAAFTWGPISTSGIPIPRPLRAGDHVRLDARTAYDPDDVIVEYSWDLQSDGAFDLTTTEPYTVIAPLAVGAWPVTLRVVDATGRSDAIMHVLHVGEAKPPQADFSLSPPTPAVHDPIRFVDRSKEGDGTIVSWEWLFGDGHRSREREPIHRYEAVGRYEVCLTVTDSDGLSDSHILSLEVRHTPEVVPTDEVWAVIIGISDYAEVEDLDFARDDAVAVASWLLDSGVPPDHVRLLTDGMDETAPAGTKPLPATLVNVREGLGWLRQVASEDDLVLIHFSGHGYQGVDDGTDEEDGVDEFFVLYDTRAAARDDTALRDDEFGRFLDRISSDHVLVLFDSCYSGGLSRSLPPGWRSSGDRADWFGDFGLEGRLIFSASSEGEEAFESPELEHGVFTHFMLDGLSGAADLNDDYHVTAWELYEYVIREVPAFVEAERGAAQHPQLLGEGETRVLLSLRERPVRADFSYDPLVPYVGGPVVFTDESSSTDADITRRWSFGDGETAIGSTTSHVFDEPGSYKVTLTLEGGEPSVSRASLSVPVAAGGTIVALDRDDKGAVIAIVSLGAQNGVRIGDHFVGERSGTSLEVVELLDTDRTACRVISSKDEIPIGEPVNPVD